MSSFIKNMALGAALVAGGAGQGNAQETKQGNAGKFQQTTSYAARETSDLNHILAGQTITDQDGKPLDIPSLMAEKPCIIAFGYGGCPLCQKITQTIAEVQQSTGAEVPIIIISIQPDIDKKDAREYVDRYKISNVREYPEGIDDDKKTPNNRLLHLAFATTQKEAIAIENKLAALINKKHELLPTKPDLHLRQLTLVNNGDVVKIAGKAVAPDGVTRVGETQDSTPALRAAAVTAIQQGLNAVRSPSRN